jgi:hypothetical protein
MNWVLNFWRSVGAPKHAYFFNGRERLELFFSSPNECAAVLGLLAVVVSGAILAVVCSAASARQQIAALIGLGGLLAGLTEGAVAPPWVVEHLDKI